MDTWTYVVLVGAVVLVLALLIPKAKQEQANAGIATSNMEIALEQFMENTELDHKELVQLVTQFREQSHAQAEAKEQRIAELERRLALLEKQAGEAAAQTQARLQEGSYQAAEASVVQAVADAPAAQSKPQVQEPDPIPAAAPAPTTIQARYAELLELYNQGKSIELIAKKLGMNKGEVQLILQLAKQEEGARA
ncbi:DUF6115 domain-containing protein [Paenibacillus radicis (ex Gao et al. 2016)]|uniref:Uncharacterized protein n=1 Tax=Paenibacillus radicis (ex Gao et al. 2016) TaxID=1737354 RepID=A0A917HIP7_9BACL|nr:hypothetical protein [Paenibacillus radicis (ex Gao et al. 2016)]GGG80588.1 hypothetical protein GCM10010918_42180 [Paenibacillus radicis (ex Gao et al. 2016)]